VKIASIIVAILLFIIFTSSFFGFGLLSILLFLMSPLFIFIIPLLVIGVFVMLFKSYKNEADKKIQNTIIRAGLSDPIWNKEKLIEIANNTFYAFQKAWAEMDVPTLEKILILDLHKRVSLEISMLASAKNKTPLVIKLINTSITKVNDDKDNENDSFNVQFFARIDKTQEESKKSKIVFGQDNSLIEIWDFKRVGNDWKLSAIHIADILTRDYPSEVPAIKKFADNYGFFYNKDFGWLTRANKDTIFSNGKYGISLINNHVIGYYRDKIVEFYTMDINSGDQNNGIRSQLIAQAVLPISYNKIIIKRKRLAQITPIGMVKHELESNEFIKEFNVYSDEKDNLSTFELLSPNLMEKIMKLPFELTIEVVGNILYLYTKDTDADYDKMLEILSYAFDEMKM
jgi:hypothetical protein